VGNNCDVSNGLHIILGRYFTLKKFAKVGIYSCKTNIIKLYKPFKLLK
jgi:hypothetical protein